MAGEDKRWFKQWQDLPVLLRWRHAARNAWTSDLPILRGQRNRARRLKHHLDSVIHVAEARLSLPQTGSQAFPVPSNSDWHWRPEVWCGPLAEPGLASVGSGAKLGGEVALFHDCARSEILLRQLRNTGLRDLAAYGLRLEVFKFEGSFLSLVVDLPKEAAEGLTKEHLLRLDCSILLEKKIEIFARLNIRNGPNTDQIVRELPLQNDELFVEFDLAYSKINENRVDRVWLDLIFEAPQMNEIVLRDLVFSRARRAVL